MLSRNASSNTRLLLGVLLAAGLGLAGVVLLAAKEPDSKPAAKDKAAAKDSTPAAKDTTPPKEAGVEGTPAADANGPRGKADRAAIVELRELADKAFHETFEFYESDNALATEVYRWSMVWLNYEMQLATDDERRVAVTQDHLERMVNLANVGFWRARELEFYVAEAEWMFDRVQPNPAFAATIAARKKLEGQWDVESIEEEGAKQNRLDIKSITVLGRRAIFEHRLGTAKAVLAVEPSSQPASIDILGMNEDFPFGGLGIYKLDGETLTICWSNAGERPTDFSTKAGDGRTLSVLKKAH